MDGLCDAGQVGNLDPLPTTPFTVVHIVRRSKMSQLGAIPICYFKVVDLIRTLQLVIGEVDVDNIAFGDFDGFPLVKIIWVVGGEVGRTFEYFASILKITNSTYSSLRLLEGCLALPAKHLRED